MENRDMQISKTAAASQPDTVNNQNIKSGKTKKNRIVYVGLLAYLHDLVYLLAGILLLLLLLFRLLYSRFPQKYLQISG